MSSLLDIVFANSSASDDVLKNTNLKICEIYNRKKGVTRCVIQLEEH